MFSIIWIQSDTVRHVCGEGFNRSVVTVDRLVLAETPPQTLFYSSSNKSLTPLSVFSVYWDPQEWTRLSLTPSDSNVPDYTLLSYGTLVKCVTYGGSFGRASNARRSVSLTIHVTEARGSDSAGLHTGLSRAARYWVMTHFPHFNLGENSPQRDFFFFFFK